MAHYEVGIRIGELSLPAGFDGLLDWGRIYNRPFLRKALDVIHQVHQDLTHE